MWKIFSLLLLCPILAQSALVQARCRFYEHQVFGYTCETANLQFMAGDELQISGIHMPERDNGNVWTVEVVNSTIEVLPQQFLISFPILRRLNANNVGISTLNRIRNCQSLQFLSLSHNKLDVIRGDTFADCSNLLSINLQNNLITNVERWALRGLTILQTFILNNNQLATLNGDLFTETPNILDIGLSNNLLSTLIARTFTPTPFVETIRLANNNLSIISVNIFQNLTQLSVLLLNGNRFDNFAANFFRHLPNLRHLNIDNNVVSF